MVEFRLPENELKEKKAEQSAPIHHHRRWQHVTELLIQFRVGSGLGGIKSPRRNGNEDE